MKEVSTVARTLSTSDGGGGGVATTSPVIVGDNCRKVARLELNYTIGIDHPHPYEDCAIGNSPCP
jgi:hypothetical protein